MLKLTASLDALHQLGLTGLLPAAEAMEHPTVKQEHNGAREEKRADGRVHYIVVILQLAHFWVTVWDIVYAKNDGGGHG